MDVGCIINLINQQNSKNLSSLPVAPINSDTDVNLSLLPG